MKLRDLVKARWPQVNVGYPFGIYSARPSEHGAGRALDVGLNANNATHQRIAHEIITWAVQNADLYGIQSVIWNRRVWGFGRWYWRAYSGPSPHTDHIHLGQNLIGAKGEWNQEDDLTPEQDARLKKVEETLEKLLDAIGAPYAPDLTVLKILTEKDGEKFVDGVKLIRQDIAALKPDGG